MYLMKSHVAIPDGITNVCLIMFAFDTPKNREGERCGCYGCYKGEYTVRE